MSEHSTSNKDKILKSIRNIPNFPKEGIQFKDITTLLKDKEALKLTHQELLAPLKALKIDKIVGLESRGFLFGVQLAMSMDAGFVPVRKPGKLPAPAITETYALEYGEGELQMHEDAINPGDKVVIHDDLIATGGTAVAATRLIQRLGGEVIAYSFIIELSFLGGRELLEQSAPVDSIIIL